MLMKLPFRIALISLLLSLWILPTAGAVPLPDGDAVRTGDPTVTKTEEGSLLVRIPFAIDGRKISSDEALLVVPVIRSLSDEGTAKELAPVLILSPKKAIILDRLADSRRETPLLGVRPKTTLVLGSRESKQYDYESAIRPEEWMKEASLSVRVVRFGCAGCKADEKTFALLDPILKEPYTPSYLLSYITPPVEPVKARADKHTATFNFKVARHELLRGYKNNAREFAQVDKVVSEVTSNPDLTLTRLTIDGYASPEGRYESNRSLSDRRAASFADYLKETFGIERSRIAVTGHGEDWDGLIQAVKASDLPQKAAILDAIEAAKDPDARDAKLRAIDRGKTYATLLSDYYPPLRRTVYTLAYNVRSFDVKEAREIIKTNPKLLSLNEMYLVADSYPKESKEFKEVFDIAVRLYPDQPIAIINAAAAEIENGSYAQAAERLSKLEDNPAALNNLGVACALSGNATKAAELFERASRLGNKEAENNLRELEKTASH